MFQFSKEKERYQRDSYTVAESLYNQYVQMHKDIERIIKLKYSGDLNVDIKSDEFKQGFIAGIKVMESIFMDM